MKKIVFYYFIISILSIISCSGPAKEATEKGNQKLRVVTTTGLLYDAVVHIGGDHVAAEAIMGPGVDPHLYKATQGDLSRINKADLVIYNGVALEGKMSEILEKLGRQKEVFAAAESIPKERLIKFSGYEDLMDPHVWFDIQLWKLVVQGISERLQKLDTGKASIYQSNTASFLKELDVLDSFVNQRLKEVPEPQRILVTAHDAFGYFGNAYDINVQGLQGISTVAEFGLKDIADIVDLILEKKIKAIFVETSVSDKSIQAVLTGCREKGHEVNIGGFLYSDAMGAIGTEEGTYVGMFKKNVNTIVDALK
ncbi:MAG: zinc ABC transporter substrate-binding protein [Bacteroidota bacterium]